MSQALENVSVTDRTPKEFHFFEKGTSDSSLDAFGPECTRHLLLIAYMSFLPQ